MRLSMHWGCIEDASRDCVWRTLQSSQFSRDLFEFSLYGRTRFKLFLLFGFECIQLQLAAFDTRLYEKHKRQHETRKCHEHRNAHLQCVVQCHNITRPLIHSHFANPHLQTRQQARIPSERSLTTRWLIPSPLYTPTAPRICMSFYFSTPTSSRMLTHSRL